MTEISEKDKKLLESIFGKLVEDSDSEPHSESYYKSFRVQFKECEENGTRYYEKCGECGHTKIICKKYGGQCNSGKCREERIGEEN